jgi:hypothetical protein
MTTRVGQLGGATVAARHVAEAAAQLRCPSLYLLMKGES